MLKILPLYHSKKGSETAKMFAIRSHFLTPFQNHFRLRENGGQGRIRTFGVVRRQIYSLFHLAALVPARFREAKSDPAPHAITPGGAGPSIFKLYHLENRPVLPAISSCKTGPFLTLSQRTKTIIIYHNTINRARIFDERSYML